MHKIDIFVQNYVVKNVGDNSGEYIGENWERWVYGARAIYSWEHSLFVGGTNGAHHSVINLG